MRNNQFAKRHYERIAEAIQEAQRRAVAIATAPTDDGDITYNGLCETMAVNTIKILVDELGDVFAGDNGQFDRSRFERACQPGNNVRARS